MEAVLMKTISADPRLLLSKHGQPERLPAHPYQPLAGHLDSVTVKKMPSKPAMP